MQDPTAFQPMKPHFPEMEQLKCPRCDSSNTKFCYYNNYNLSQPRHFCKNCRRYWTKGGALRNIPVGGGTRKNNTKKRQKPDPDPPRNNNPTRKGQESLRPGTAAGSATPSQEAVGGTDTDPRRLYGLGVDPDHKMLDITGSFSSLLASNGGIGSVLDGMNSSGSGLKMVQMGSFGENFGSGPNLESFPGGGSGSENQGNNGDSSCWSGGNNGWPDLAIYTPSSNFQ